MPLLCEVSVNDTPLSMKYSQDTLMVIHIGHLLPLAFCFTVSESHVFSLDCEALEV